MTPARLRELAAAIDVADRLPDLIGDPLASGESVTTATAGEAILWAAKEIERLRRLATSGWETVQTLAVCAGHAASERRSIAVLAEIEAAS